MSDLVEDIEIFARAKEKMGGVDNRMLLWLLKGTVLLDVPMFSYQSALVDELEDRLYPDYDGDTVKMEDFGWRTPEGLVIYTDTFCTEVHENDQTCPAQCCKCPYCFRHFKAAFYAGHPDKCNLRPDPALIQTGETQ